MCGLTGAFLAKQLKLHQGGLIRKGKEKRARIREQWTISVSLTQTAGMHMELEDDLGTKEGMRAKTSPLGSKLLVKAQERPSNC